MSDADAQSLILAILREWAAVDPEEAASWALRHAVVPHDLAFSAIFHGAAAQPEAAVALARRLSASDPARASSYGTHLMFALCANGVPAVAVEFATSTPVSPETQRNWLTIAYGRWADISPHSALESAATLQPEITETAFQATVTGWARSSPESVASFGLSLPAGNLRRFAIVAALQQWFDQDPPGAAAWLSAHGVSAGLDVDHVRRALED